MKTNDTQPREEGETTGTARRPKQHLAQTELSYKFDEESVALIAEARSASDGRAAKTPSSYFTLKLGRFLSPNAVHMRERSR